MDAHKVVSREEWLEARKALLEDEKRFTRERDALSEKRRGLPWVRIEKDYAFDGPKGRQTLSDLFDGSSQLVVYHFMYPAEWKAGCKSCSFSADSFNGIRDHLRQHDVAMVAISAAPRPQLETFRRRMGWSFPWLSSAGSDFSRDFGVSFTAAEIEAGGGSYNFGTSRFRVPEAPGISVFTKDASGAVFHTYSCYSRGLDMMNAAYQYLDLVPKGRDEEALSYPMEWVRLRDEYGRSETLSA
jgi:predicted dithiol-disulfide oxidoreductase (DUF899 family)